jgi:hypothetical protein
MSHINTPYSLSTVLSSKSAFDICQKASLRVIGNDLAYVTLLLKLKLLGFCEYGFRGPP